VKRKVITLWTVENEDEAGEGLFICQAVDRKQAIGNYLASGGKVSEIRAVEEVDWIDLAYVSDSRGAGMWRKRRQP